MRSGKASVALHMHRKRAFVEADGETIWVKKLLKRSLFECVSDARQFVFAKRDDGFQCTWVSELQQRHVGGSISLTIGLVPLRMAVVSYMAFLAGRPQGPVRVFWNLRSFQSSMQLQGLSTRQAQPWIREGMARTWSSMLLKSGCADSWHATRGRSSTMPPGCQPRPCTPLFPPGLSCI